MPWSDEIHVARRIAWQFDAAVASLQCTSAKTRGGGRSELSHHKARHRRVKLRLQRSGVVAFLFPTRDRGIHATAYIRTYITLKTRLSCTASCCTVCCFRIAYLGCVGSRTVVVTHPRRASRVTHPTVGAEPVGDGSAGAAFFPGLGTWRTPRKPHALSRLAGNETVAKKSVSGDIRG